MHSVDSRLNDNIRRGSARASSFRCNDIDFIQAQGIIRRFQTIARWEELIETTQEMMISRKKLGHPFHHFYTL